MFFLKKIVSRFLFPLPLSLEFLFAGLFLLWFTRRQRAGKALVTCGTLLLAGLSNMFTAHALLHPLEHAYPSITVVHSGSATPPVTFIAVLGGWATDDPAVPISSHVSPDLMVRLIQGLLLQREITGSRLILSGDGDSAKAMATLARALGVSSSEIVELPEPRDTEEESRLMSPIVGRNRLILVTSASHMPRAMLLFHKRGLNPLAAPTDYLAARHAVESDDLFPDAYKLFKTQVAFYEYLGLAWESLRRVI